MSGRVLTIIAGANGCGKSTLTSTARSKFQQTPVLDPDAIAKSLQDTVEVSKSNIEAGKRVHLLAEEFIASGQSSTIETTLSGSTYLRMAQRAKMAEFNVTIVFVGTTSIEINLERVKARVEMGGHDVPEEDQRRRYPRTCEHEEVATGCRSRRDSRQFDCAGTHVGGLWPCGVYALGGTGAGVATSLRF